MKTKLVALLALYFSFTVSFSQVEKFVGQRINLSETNDTAVIKLNPFKGSAQWQVKKKNGVAWTDHSVSESGELRVPFSEIAADSIAYYRAIITADGCEATFSDSMAVGILNMTPEIQGTYFAQTHVSEPTDPYFKLVSNTPALFKAQIVSGTSPSSVPPEVKIILRLNGKSKIEYLTGPKSLPGSFNKDPGTLVHKMNDSYTYMIESEWMQPGLELAVIAGNTRVDLEDLKIGPPNVVDMLMVDAHFFKLKDKDYADGWQKELQAKWPTSNIDLQRVREVIFKELTVPPRGGAVAARVDSKEKYTEITGLNFDGEQAAALQWRGALSRAAGRSEKMKLYYINIYGTPAGGQAGGYGGVGNGKKVGILHHELGHALSLPHAGDDSQFPYKGEMHGIAPPETFREVHVGPVWAFDMPTQTFIPPTVQPESVNGAPVGIYKRSPMQGGGTGDQENIFLLRHFSDYEVKRMNDYMEAILVEWSEELNSYVKWNKAEGAYTQLISNNGVQYPIEREVEVYSVMAGVSSTTPQANIAYQPIGPYRTGIIELFDPSKSEDRLRADQIYCPSGGCDVSLRVTQGGETKTYMLPLTVNALANPLSGGSFQTEAVNLKAEDGKITSVELISTPDAEKNGLPTNPEILHSWSE